MEEEGERQEGVGWMREQGEGQVTSGLGTEQKTDPSEDDDDLGQTPPSKKQRFAKIKECALCQHGPTTQPNPTQPNPTHPLKCRRS